MSFDISLYMCRECADKANVKAVPYRTLDEFGFSVDAPQNCCKCGKTLNAREGIYKAQE